MDDAATTRSPDSRAPPALRPEFEDFFRSRFAQVARAMMLAVHDRDLGEQIAQEAFTRLYEHWSEIESEDHAVRFAYRTALNLAASHHRRERRWRSRRAEPSGEPTPGPEETVATRLEVFAALSLLSPKQRACVVLVDYSGFDDRSAAELIGIAPATVRVHLTRARRALRASLGASDDEERE